MIQETCLKIKTCVFLFAYFGASITVQAATVTGVIRIEDATGKNCSILATGESTTTYSLDCDNNRSQITFDAVPSTSKVLISPGDCSRSLEDQDWWVELEALNKSTSSTPLSIRAIVDSAQAMQPGQSNYAAPYIKITNAEVSNPSGQARCVAITLPSLGRPDSGFKFNPNPTQGSKRTNHDYHGRCKNGAMINLYSFEAEKFNFQCGGPIIGNDGVEYQPDNYQTIYFTIDSPPAKCPANMAVIDLLLSREGSTRQKSHIECASFKNKTTGKTLKLTENDYAQRKIENDGHNLICEENTQLGRLVSQPNNLITGIDRSSSTKQLVCSTMSAE